MPNPASHTHIFLFPSYPLSSSYSPLIHLSFYFPLSLFHLLTPLSHKYLSHSLFLSPHLPPLSHTYISTVFACLVFSHFLHTLLRHSPTHTSSISLSVYFNLNLSICFSLIISLYHSLSSVPITPFHSLSLSLHILHSIFSSFSLSSSLNTHTSVYLPFFSLSTFLKKLNLQRGRFLFENESVLSGIKWLQKVPVVVRNKVVTKGSCSCQE